MTALLLVAAGARARFESLEAAWVPQAPDEAAYRWNSRFVEAVSIGFSTLIADISWMRALQDSAVGAVAAGHHASIFHDFDLATDLDPGFFEVFAYGSVLLSIARRDAAGALKLLNKGERVRTEERDRYPEWFWKKYWYHEWAIPMQIAYVELFEFENLPRASTAFRKSAAAPGSPPYLRSLAKRLSTRPGVLEVAERLLRFQIDQARRLERPRAEARLKGKLAELRVIRFVERVNREYAEFAPPGKRSDEDQFGRFLKEKGYSGRDPAGGGLFLADDGSVRTTTRTGKVLGLELDS